MPDRKHEIHIYTVTSLSYTTQEIADRVKADSHFIPAIEDITARSYYLGKTERQAAYQLYKAIHDAQSDPLMYQVTLKRDGEIVVKVPLNR